MTGSESVYEPEESEMSKLVTGDPRLRLEELLGEEAEKYQANLYGSWQEAAGLLLNAPLSQRAINELQAAGKTTIEVSENPHLKLIEGSNIELQQHQLQDLANIVTRVTLQVTNEEGREPDKGVDFIYLLSNAANGKTTNLAQFLNRDVKIVTVNPQTIPDYNPEVFEHRYFGRFSFGDNYVPEIPTLAEVMALEANEAGMLVVLLHEIGHAIDYQHADKDRRAIIDLAAQIEHTQYERTATLYEIIEASISIERTAWANSLKIIRRFEREGIVADPTFMTNAIALMSQALRGYEEKLLQREDKTVRYTSEERARYRRMESRILKEMQRIDHESSQE